MDNFKNLLINKWILPIASVLMICFISVSCLKSGEGFPSSSDKVTDVVLLGNAVTPNSYTTIYQAFNVSGEFENDTTGFDFVVQYAGSASNAPQDITINLGLDTAAITKYNEENETEYVLFDSTMISFAKTVTIPKGSDHVTVRATVKKTSTYDYSKTYTLPLTIVSSSFGTISSNGATKLYAFVAKNELDGIYQYTTSAATSLLPNRNVEVKLASVAQFTVQLDPGLLGAYTNVVQYTYDPTTYKITVTCPSLGVYTPQDTRSVFDPTTHNLKVYWKQGNGNRTFEETFTYKGVR